MPPFPHGAQPIGQLDFELVKDGPMTLFWREHLLDNAVTELRDLGYAIREVETATGDIELLDAIARALDFPNYFGRNLDALNDCLHDVAAYEYGADPRSTGTVVVFRHYDRVVRHAPDDAHAVLDIFADRSREALLFGHLMLVLIHSDDPDAAFEPLGGVRPHWNQQEWFDISRHPDRSPRNPMEAMALERARELDRQ